MEYDNGQESFLTLVQGKVKIPEGRGSSTRFVKFSNGPNTISE
jgi:hypothetical protein